MCSAAMIAIKPSALAGEESALLDAKSYETHLESAAH